MLTLIYRVGGITTAIATAPLDVLRTRFQSNLYSHPWQSSAVVTTPQTSSVKAWLERVKITSRGVIMLQKVQGWRGLYTGLGPSILGAVPATAVNSYTYGNCKRIYADWFGLKENASSVHMTAAMTAGIVTGTITNPIWVVKTRMQLDSSPTTTRPRHRTAPVCNMSCTSSNKKASGDSIAGSVQAISVLLRVLFTLSSMKGSKRSHKAVPLCLSKSQIPNDYHNRNHGLSSCPM